VGGGGWGGGVGVGKTAIVPATLVFIRFSFERDGVHPLSIASAANTTSRLFMKRLRRIVWLMVVPPCFNFISSVSLITLHNCNSTILFARFADSSKYLCLPGLKALACYPADWDYHLAGGYNIA
jgi:hypothetical protein